MYVRHGKRYAPEYKPWANLLSRCRDPNNTNYHRYGGRGIKVCERWTLFENFYEDMGRRPNEKYSIDRIDHNGDYTPENCRWATIAEQNRNHSRNRWITFNGETLCLMDWSRRIGIASPNLAKRLDKGWSIEKALTTPPRNKYPGLRKFVPLKAKKQDYEEAA